MIAASTDLAAAVLNALAANIAVLDADGTIVVVNDSWRRFAQDNASPAVGAGAGTSANYVSVCERAARTGDASATAMLAGLREVISGARKEFILEYPCHSPTVERWFLARVTRCEWQNSLYAVVAHEDITARVQAELALRATDRSLRETMEALQVAKAAVDATNAELQLALAREKSAARTDELTGAHNRRYFFDVAEQLFDVARRYDRPLSVIMLDVDHFKQFNDRHGHATGDRALIELVAAVQEHLRAADVFARYGGEEFIVLLPDSTAQEASHVTERILAGVRERPIQADAETIGMTVSAGVTERHADDNRLASVIRRADEALYLAKKGGRDRAVVLAGAFTSRN